MDHADRTAPEVCALPELELCIEENSVRAGQMVSDSPCRFDMPGQASLVFALSLVGLSSSVHCTERSSDLAAMRYAWVGFAQATQALDQRRRLAIQYL